MADNMAHQNPGTIHRRDFIKAGMAATFCAGINCRGFRREPVMIQRVRDYSSDLKNVLLNGFRELSITPGHIAGRSVLLKPNLVEPHKDAKHINTNPLLVRAAVEAFLHLGAKTVIVAEGAGHMRDSYLILEESGLADVLYEGSIRFVDLNVAPVRGITNIGGTMGVRKLLVPELVLNSDIIVSMPKMKTHHWAGVTLSLKNMFGIMPGSCYGWPKNLLHLAGIENSIIDIHSSVKTHLAIVDGIVGMEGDGPIMGTPVAANVVVMGKNLAAVDATCARIMGIDPWSIRHLKMAEGILGPIAESHVKQVGENIESVGTVFNRTV
jgi:uncharacterized protein (DUF362 family)